MAVMVSPFDNSTIWTAKRGKNLSETLGTAIFIFLIFRGFIAFFRVSTAPEFGGDEITPDFQQPLGTLNRIETADETLYGLSCPDHFRPQSECEILKRIHWLYWYCADTRRCLFYWPNPESRRPKHRFSLCQAKKAAFQSYPSRSPPFWRSLPMHAGLSTPRSRLLHHQLIAWTENKRCTQSILNSRFF